MSTALTQLYYHTMARPRVVSEKESLLEGESGPTPAEKTLPTPCQQDRSWPSLEDGNGDIYIHGRAISRISHLCFVALPFGTWWVTPNPPSMLSSVSAEDQFSPKFQGGLRCHEISTFSLRQLTCCLLYTSPSPRDKRQSRMPSSA